ncbi:reverse transcriptase domain-containing protein [Cylindrospermopsis raciborskii]|uniref:Group II intron reverse transcriptase/maturase n=1 Tax=Cylindrospermopsis raciborskii CENA302 TaxID=1170768 RepID=A0A9Q5QWM6_9CYAN|nr:reverse transcriptase domain-containing protein [Cylindrospermopsis raciborskii]NLQ05685.1 group II intron reverse transcriptase/maturase [Cylindrospermopsis raciborskii MVCC19]OHY36396.1 group II intron reverse transcriptase/maturase [Cylindrospermopsis raciborskii MVCC14]OPH09753.1 group II intron reverse transcriptase/maturase [Cylindrospermopsis raciborskii CENA302]
MTKAQEAVWTRLDWSEIQYKVSRLQSKIYQASLTGDKSSVVKYQKILINSYSAKLLAIKKVTQDNKGKKTADGKEWVKLAQNLELDGKASPLTWVKVPKSNGEFGNLGVPTGEDKAKQALARMALEPEWEAKFEPNSYGFRPGRSYHDAIIAIEVQVRTRTNYVLSVDMGGCFDKIKHEAIIQRCNTFPIMERQIIAWLKSGVMIGDVFHPMERGVPVGGVISPLLVNIALHGLETHISQKLPSANQAQGKLGGLVRYAHDFLVLHWEEETIKAAKTEVETWLGEIGLNLNQQKVRMCHTMEEYNGEKPGLDFLGFNIRTYKIGKYKSSEKVNGEFPGMLTKVKPSEKSVERFVNDIKETLNQGHDKNPPMMIRQLGWIIRSWANYFKSGSHSWETFGELESHRLDKVYLNWGRKRFAKDGLGYIRKKIFHKTPRKTSTFGWKEGNTLFTVPTLYEFPYAQHIKVEGIKSPYDGDWVYWTERMADHPQTPQDIKFGIIQQKGKCYLCGQNLTVEDSLEIYYIDGNKSNNRKGKAVVHNHCHESHQRMTVSQKEILGVA